MAAPILSLKAELRIVLNAFDPCLTGRAADDDISPTPPMFPRPFSPLKIYMNFDSIRHGFLLQKLQSIGVASSSLEWFHNYLSGRSQRVRIGDAISDPLPLKYGVPQGSILGPVLFTIYVNDLLSVPAHCKSVCYIDDCKLYLSLRSTDIARVFGYLNEDLREICPWCCQNSLLINPAKTRILLVGVPQLLRKLPPTSISLSGNNTSPCGKGPWSLHRPVLNI